MKNNCYKIPFLTGSVAAGFPAMMSEIIEKQLDIAEYLITNPNGTFVIKASGNSMLKAGIYDGDLLIVDRSREPRSGDIVIASIDGELTVKRLITYSENKLALEADNDGYKPILIPENTDLQIWGVVTFAIHEI